MISVNKPILTGLHYNSVGICGSLIINIFAHGQYKIHKQFRVATIEYPDILFTVLLPITKVYEEFLVRTLSVKVGNPDSSVLEFLFGINPAVTSFFVISIL